MKLFIFQKKYPTNWSVKTILCPTKQISLKNIWKKQRSAKQISTILGLHIYAKARNQQWMQSKATQLKQWITMTVTAKTQQTIQLVKECKIEQQQGQDTENFLETSSAKHKSEKRMKKFDMDFGTKMQACLARKNLELEMQMRELKTKHNLLKEESELKRKVKEQQ